MIRLAGGGGGGGSVPSIPAIMFGGTTDVFAPSAENVCAGCGIYLPCEVVVNNIVIYVNDTDDTALCDAGLYTKAGSLVAHIGAQVLPAPGITAFPVIGGPLTLSPGAYVFAFTENAFTCNLVGAGYLSTWYYSSDFAASVGGELPASVGAFTPAPSDAIAWLVLD